MKNNPSYLPPESIKTQFINENNIFEMSCMKTDLTKPTQHQNQIIYKPISPVKIVDFRQCKTDYQVSSQAERSQRRASHTSKASSHIKKFKKNKAQQQIKKPITDIKFNYDVWDLTYTLIQSKMKIYTSATWFFTFLGIRVYSLICCIYISLHSVHIQWLIPFILVRVVFFILVLKISLNDPTTKTQVVLKTHWNSIQNDTKQYFQVMSFNKLGTSILRGLIPAEFSFFYIKSEEIKRKYQIFTAINFIFVSIEQIVFYPFFIGYCAVIVQNQEFSIDIRYQISAIFIASGGLLVFIILTIYLFILGVKKKYGKIRYWLSHKRYTMRKNKYDYQKVDLEGILST